MKIHQPYTNLPIILLSTLLPIFISILSKNNESIIQKNCANRYTIIQKILNKYERPFTILDLGAHQGYHSFRAARDYPAVCIMTNTNQNNMRINDQLLSLCEINDLDTIIFLKKTLNIADIKRLGTCEHFDVTLAMNIIHQFENQWQQTIDATIKLGDNTIIEAQSTEKHLSKSENKKRKEVIDYILSKGGIPIGNIKSDTNNSYSTLYCIEKKKDIIKYGSWLAQASNEEKNIKIESTFKHKYLIKKDETITWVPGINLVTFKMCNGTYPHTKDLIALLKTIEDPEHDDWMPNNMILQGKKLVLIDKHVPPVSIFPFLPESRSSVAEWLSLNNPKKLRHHFYKTLLPKLIRRHKKVKK